MDGQPFPDDDLPIFKVTEAVREAVPALIALWGFSDSGKTYSALRLGRGLVGPKGKIVVIDTENKRAKLYAGLFGGWQHIDMQPPFTPQRYTAAFDAARRAGANVIIVDSMSHVWEGEGGVLDQADASTSKGLMKWKAPKTAYKRMTNALFRSPVHMIFCVRAKEKFVQQLDSRGKESIVSAGHVPICDNRFIYEMTVAAHMESGTRCPLGPVKAPDPIARAIVPGEYIAEECGEKIAAWLAGGAPVDHETAALATSARAVAAEGTEALRKWWMTLSKAQRASLGDIIAELKDLATEADAEAEEARQRVDDANQGGDPLDDPFTRSETASAASAKPEATDRPDPEPAGETSPSPAAAADAPPKLPAKPTRDHWRAWTEWAVAEGLKLKTVDDVAAFVKAHAAVLGKLDEHEPSMRQEIRAALGE